MKKYVFALLALCLAIFAGCVTRNGKGGRAADTAGSADVVIVGAGGAGMAAAVEILEAGKTVIMVDKMPSIGGNTLVAGSAMNSADPDMQRAIKMDPGMMTVIQGFVDLPAKNEIMAGWQAVLKKEFDAYKAANSTYLFDSPSLHKLQTYVDGDYVANPKLVDVYGDNTLAGIKWLESLGTKWKDVSTAIGATWMRSHNPHPDMGPRGAAFFNPPYKRVQELGGTVLTEHKATEIVMKGGRAVGVKGTKADGSKFTFNANNGVIISTGGFGANVELRQKYNKFWPTLDKSVGTTNVSSAMGDGIIMAEAAGANLVGMEWIQMLNNAKITFTADIANRIFVNAEGKRFVKEDGRRDEMAFATLQQTDGKYFSICEAHTVWDLLGGIAASTSKPVDDLVNNTTFFRGETLEEACKNAGLPYATVKAEVDDYNLNSIDRKNDRFGRKVVQYKLDKGPWYINSGVPLVHHTMGGIEINERAQVIGKSGSVIPGLFAAGEVTGGIHGANRLGGNAIADVIVFGRIAGKSAAGR